MALTDRPLTSSTNKEELGGQGARYKITLKACLLETKSQDMKDRADKSAFQTWEIFAGAGWMVGRFTVMEAESFNTGHREGRGHC